MKKLFLPIILLFLVGLAWGSDEKSKLISPCPKTKMIEDCLKCHVVGNFKVKETKPDAHLVYPNSSMKIMGWDTGKLYGYFLLGSIDSDGIRDFFDYLRDKGIGKAVIEIHSPGGSLFGAQRIISLIQGWQSEGRELETRVNGFAASAGFLIFVAGDKGKRFVCPQADLMWHELYTFKFIDVATPSDKEEEARVLRHLQSIRNEWLASRSKISKKEIDDLVRKKEFWLSGKQAVEFGFADGFIGK